jgi:hypothetical protein
MSEMDDLEDNRIDKAVAVVKGIAGLIPSVGSIVSELIGNVIPNQRLDRIARFARILSKRISEIDEKLVRERLRNEEAIDLIEDGFFQASRARQQDRLHQLAVLIKNGLSEEENRIAQSRHLMSILGQLDDVQILHLQFYGLDSRPTDQQKFYLDNKSAIVGPRALAGSSREVMDQDIVFRSQKEEMVRLGVLQRKFKSPKRGELPEFDEKTGMIKASGYSITSLGRMLLRQIELPMEEASE